MQGVIGAVKSIHFEWMLDTRQTWTNRAAVADDKPLGQAADEQAGADSIIFGTLANLSMATGLPLRIANLSGLKRRADAAPRQWPRMLRPNLQVSATVPERKGSEGSTQYLWQTATQRDDKDFPKSIRQSRSLLKLWQKGLGTFD